MSTAKLQVGLVALGLLLAGGSLAVDLLGACGACGAAEPHRVAIGGVGFAGYLALGVAAWGGAGGLFQAGVLAAAAVHTALLTWMATMGTLCPVCLAAGLSALANAGIGLASGRAPLALVERAYLPVLLVASGLAFALALRASEDSSTRRSAARVALATSASVPPTTVIRVLVYENDHCGYCREFRDACAPRLTEEFGPRVAIEYRAAEGAAWVRRTPTLAIEGGDVFEGLPARYEDLRSAVATALRTREEKGR